MLAGTARGGKKGSGVGEAK